MVAKNARENKNKPFRARTVTKLRELRQRRRRPATRTAKRQTGWIKKKTLHVHHAVLDLYSPSLYNHNVKLPNFSFCGGRETQDKDFLFFFNLDTVLWNSTIEKFTNVIDKLNDME